MSNQLTPEQVQSFLDRHKDPADARKFLQEAGLIDENGDLTGPYRPEKERTTTDPRQSYERGEHALMLTTEEVSLLCDVIYRSRVTATEALAELNVKVHELYEDTVLKAPR